ncbi:MAG TPA: hypothetical protein VJN18_30645 [Polyangiaceae bacterium]|nr:hypothetical protein [Polyangiaceae bacterium]
MDFTDGETGKVYPVRMDERGTFTHSHGLALATALEEWEDTAKEPNGKPTHEEWKDRLKEHNRRRHREPSASS